MESRHGAQHCDLHISRQTCAHALHIHLMRAESFRLDKNLMPVFVRKTHELVLNARAIARAGGVDLSAVHGGSMQVIENDAVRVRVCIGQIARRLLPRESAVEKRKRGRRHITVLPLHFVIIERASVHARGRTRFKPLERYAELFERIRERLGAEQARRPAVAHKIPDQNPALHVDAGADHDRATAVGKTFRRDHAGDSSALGQKPARFALRKG